MITLIFLMGLIWAQQLRGGCMKYPRNAFYPAFMLLTLLAACGPVTPGTGPINNGPIPLPNVLVTVASPGLALPCTPPIPTICQDAPYQPTAYCANQIKGVGGITFSDCTSLKEDDTASSWLVGDSIAADVSCNLDQGTSTATCSGPQYGTFEATVCASCGEYNVSSNASFVCANGYNDDGQGNCYAVDPNKNLPSMWCPAGSHYDNALQNCADNVTNKLASPCPPGYPHYTPYNHACWNKAEMAFNCQTFPLGLGGCIATNKIFINVVPFCENKAADKGGANMTYPAGSSLKVDTKANRLDGCTPGGTQPDGTQLVTCWGAAGMTFNVQLCTDPATCTSYTEVLGTCAGKNNPACDPRTMRCP
jgi:hypothetical protein